MMIMYSHVGRRSRFLWLQVAASVLGVLLAEMGAGPRMAWATGSDRPPRYDVDSYCSQQANTPDGFDPGTMSRCLMVQSDALDQVKRLWLDTPEYIQRDCDSRAHANGDPDYLLLYRCMYDQLQQQSPNR